MMMMILLIIIYRILTFVRRVLLTFETRSRNGQLTKERTNARIHLRSGVGNLLSFRAILIFMTSCASRKKVSTKIEPGLFGQAVVSPQIINTLPERTIPACLALLSSQSIFLQLIGRKMCSVTLKNIGKRLLGLCKIHVYR